MKQRARCRDRMLGQVCCLGTLIACAAMWHGMLSSTPTTVCYRHVSRVGCLMHAAQLCHTCVMFAVALLLQAKPIADMFPHASDDALDLLVKLLQVRGSKASPYISVP